LIRILDVQRSGQIAEAILEDAEIGLFSHADLVKLVEGFRAYHPGVFGDYVDWYKVEARGSKNKYPKDKKKQAATHGLSEAQIALVSEVIKQQIIEEKAKITAKAEFAATHFELLPGVYAKIIVPKSRAA
jgi:hypothetical protein